MADAAAQPDSLDAAYRSRVEELLHTRQEMTALRQASAEAVSMLRRLRADLRSLSAESHHLVAQLVVTMGPPRSAARKEIASPAPKVLPAPAAAGDNPLGLLTARELQVLRLIAEQNSTKEIAAALGISFKTAVCHRSHIMEKLGIHNVAGLVRCALRHGLIKD